MRTNKCTRLFSGINEVLDRYDRDTVKSSIGDSINNNRTLTVNQVVRFLTTRRTPALKKLGFNLEVAYESVRPAINEYRLLNTNRTDAIDINEFLTFFFYDVITSTNTSSVKSISQKLGTL